MRKRTCTENKALQTKNPNDLTANAPAIIGKTARNVAKNAKEAHGRHNTQTNANVRTHIYIYITNIRANNGSRFCTRTNAHIRTNKRGSARASKHARARTQPPLNCHSPSGWATRGGETCAHIAEHGPQQKKHRRNKNTAQPRGETHRTRGALAVQHAWGHQLRHCIQEKKPRNDHMARHIAQQPW